MVNGNGQFNTGSAIGQGASVTISAKTGTAETYTTTPSGEVVTAINTNVVAYAPSDNPQIAVSVVLPNLTNQSSMTTKTIMREIINLYQSMYPIKLRRPMLYPTPIAKLIDSYSKLPGIGIKTATRLAFYTIGMEDDVVNEFAKNLLAAKRDLSYCSICGNLTDQDPCAICQDSTRDQSTILIVEDSRDVTALENIQEYHGLYHVLHGLISPMNGIGPDDINLKSLLTRLMDNEVTEVIVATNATADGEATSMYISRVLKPAGIKVTRLARGLAVGSDIEYADEVTLLRAIENRTEL